MNNATIATLVGLSMYALAACEKAADESAQNAAQAPQVSFEADATAQALARRRG